MKPVTRRTRFPVCVLTALSLVPTFVPGQGASRDTHPGFEGIWNSAMATPLERPRHLNDKPFFTPEQAAEWEHHVAEHNEVRPPQAPATNVGTGTLQHVLPRVRLPHRQDPPGLHRDRPHRRPHSAAHARV